MRDRRIGRFVISFDAINDRPDDVKAALAGVIVIRAEALWHNGNIVYYGICNSFDGVPPGEEAPSYEWEITQGRRVWTKEEARG